jgi:hypothetical protein
MNSNYRLTSHASPGRDPVLIAIQAACIILACAAAALIVAGCQRHQAQAALNCPPQDHPVWAQVLGHGHGEWICGASITVGVKSR